MTVSLELGQVSDPYARRALEQLALNGTGTGTGGGGTQGPQGPQGPQGDPGPAGPQGPAGLAAPRQTSAVTTASLAGGAGQSGTVALATSFSVLRVQTSRAARVRLYETPAYRDADVARPLGTDPSGDHGQVLEVATAAALLDLHLSPTAEGASFEVPPSVNIAYRIDNLDVAGAVTVTFTYQAQEG